jgi:hypothetical protein
VVLKILKWQVLRTLKNVLNIDKPHKRRKKESESETFLNLPNPSDHAKPWDLPAS